MASGNSLTYSKYTSPHFV